mmetsp:Transcript_24704/g.27487  ORF Transcript_24704/g.27487 Transcript_24704/m.27487 type:complete len:188 (-) Transcript_24704:54-617(-)
MLRTLVNAAQRQMGSTFGIIKEETPDHTVLANKGSYEIRKYPSLLIAETTYNGNDSIGFRSLAGFIFGKNTVGDTNTSANVAMTAPVEIKKLDNKRIMRFIMPSKYTIDTLPKPKDASVAIKQTEGLIVAVRKFSGYTGDDKLKTQREALLSDLNKDKVTLNPDEDWYYNQYNPPLYVLYYHYFLVL